MRARRSNRIVVAAGATALAVTFALLWVSRGEVLYAASGAGWTRSVWLLLALGVDPNGANSPEGANMYPLLVAAITGQTEVVQLLLQAGANPNLSCCDVTVLGAAASGGHTAIVRLLLAAGASPRISGGLVAAARRGDREMVLLLLEAGADVSERGSVSGKDSIGVARSHGHEDIARLLEIWRR